MAERLADVRARVDGVRQLGAVVNALRGISATRAQAARGQLAAVDSYLATIGASIGQALALAPEARRDGAAHARGSALLLFGAEEGFVGAFSERLLDAAAAELDGSSLFLIGTRAAAIAAERGVVGTWQGAMPSHSAGIPKLADRIAEALYPRLAAGEIGGLDTIYARWEPGVGFAVQRDRLFPLDMSAMSPARAAVAPLANLRPESLLGELTAEYLHAQLCHAALHAFAAENQARMETMASAHRQVERRLSALRATERLVRQEEITAEIVELAAGEAASRASRRSEG